MELLMTYFGIDWSHDPIGSCACSRILFTKDVQEYLTLQNCRRYQNIFVIPFMAIVYKDTHFYTFITDNIGVIKDQYFI